ncbi:hypothetical protein AGMMS50276_00580 [Synergistales bacterium]|nr:hypothetical protein AGMMS50276_00580 [Synergistales bacterium]
MCPVAYSGVRAAKNELAFPRLIPVRQNFDAESIEDIEAHVGAQVDSFLAATPLKKGAKAALAVGSRGIAKLDEIVKALIEALRRHEIEPFIVPAMGSHGGATEKGQAKLLKEFGITETSMGVEIRSSMDVVTLGEAMPGLPVYFDRIACECADFVVPVVRVKNHTTFRGDIESGLHKMLCVGLGNHKGAQAMHQYGIEHFGEIIPKAGQYVLGKVSVPFGIAVVENAKELPSVIEAVPGARFASREPELLQISREMMARLCFDELDVLVVREMGKNISGVGMDPNITCRYQASHMPDGPLKIQRIVALSLTKETHGNALGIGCADICTRQLVYDIDFETTCTNAITATRLDRVKIPMIAATAKDAIAVALKTCTGDKTLPPRLVVIKNTLEIEEIYVSEGLLSYVDKHPRLSVAGEAREMSFDDGGNLKL